MRQPCWSNDRAALHGGDSHREAASPGNHGSVRRAQDQSPSPLGPSENGKLLLLVWLCSSVQEQGEEQGQSRGTGNPASLRTAFLRKTRQGDAGASGEAYALWLPVAMLLQIICSPVGLPRLSSREESCRQASNYTLVNPPGMQSVRHQHLTALG